MFLPSPPSVLVLALLHGAPVLRPPTATGCEDVQRIELALTPSATAREVCVSQGIMTSFLFDTLVDVELQDEMRFVEVLRSRSSISFVPPREMASGERLRLTARLGAGATQGVVTFTLVAYSGKATHQVEVYHDRRPREALQNEVLQERVKVRHLREKLTQMRIQFEQSGGLEDLVLRKKISAKGIQGQIFKPELHTEPEEFITFLVGSSYRSDITVVAEMSLSNMGSEPWMTAEASLVDAHGNELKEMRLQQDKPIPPEGEGTIIIAIDAMRKEAQGEWTLTLRSDGVRSITLTGVSFP